MYLCKHSPPIHPFKAQLRTCVSLLISAGQLHLPKKAKYTQRVVIKFVLKENKQQPPHTHTQLKILLYFELSIMNTVQYKALWDDCCYITKTELNWRQYCANTSRTLLCSPRKETTFCWSYISLVILLIFLFTDLQTFLNT